MSCPEGCFDKLNYHTNHVAVCATWLQGLHFCILGARLTFECLANVNPPGINTCTGFCLVFWGTITPNWSSTCAGINWGVCDFVSGFMGTHATVSNVDTKPGLSSAKRGWCSVRGDFLAWSVYIYIYPSSVSENYQSFKRNLWSIPQMNKEIGKITTCSLLDLETLGFLSNYAHKSPWTLTWSCQESCFDKLNYHTNHVAVCVTWLKGLYFFISGARLTYDCLTHPESAPAQVFAWLFGDQLHPTDQALVQGLIKEYATLCQNSWEHKCYCLKCGHKACVSSAKRGWCSVPGDFWAWSVDIFIYPSSVSESNWLHVDIFRFFFT